MKKKQKAPENTAFAGGADGKKKKPLIWGAAAAVAVIAAAVIGFFAYTGSPSYKAGKALKEAESCLAEKDYEQAISQLRQALELDPDNEELNASIHTHLEEFLQIAESCGEAGDYEAERRMASYVLLFQQNNEQAEALIAHAGIQELLDQAQKEIDAGNYEGAKEKYNEALAGGAQEDEIAQYLLRCDAYMELLSSCEGEKWIGLAGYLDSRKFDAIIAGTDMTEPQYIAGGVKIIIGEKDGSYYVITGDLDKDNGTGKAVGVISSANTYAIYEGGWADYLPEGEGTLSVWNKNEIATAAMLYTGNFAGGMMDGPVVLKTASTELNLTVSAGAVSVFKTDEEGNIWLTDSIGTGTYVAADMTEANGTIAGYSAGVPGFGGSDVKFPVKFMSFDKIPPVLSCKLKLNKWYPMPEMSLDPPIAESFRAMDDVDGDISSEIRWSGGRTAETIEESNEWYIDQGSAVLSVTDGAGNEATLTVTYQCYYGMCENRYKILAFE